MCFSIFLQLILLKSDFLKELTQRWIVLSKNLYVDLLKRKVKEKFNYRILRKTNLMPEVGVVLFAMKYLKIN
jgi:hypothetical protein